MIQESYIKSFNDKVKELITLQPNNGVLKSITEYKNLNRHPDFYSALDDLGVIVGLEFAIEILFDEKEEAYYRPYVKLIDKESEESLQIKYFGGESNLLRSLDYCHSFLAKEYVYLLQDIPNIQLKLEEIILRINNKKVC